MDSPPKKLVRLLEELGLATPDQVASVGRRARRLARQLPLLESVWIDALVQARQLTAWQSGELKAGRGEQLRVGSFLLEEPLDWPDFGHAYRARQIGGRAVFRLVLLTTRPGQPDPIGRLESLAGRAPELTLLGVAPIVCAGVDDQRCFVASAWCEGISASRWMIHHGRFSPPAVLEIARQMAAALAAVEKAGLCHADLSPRGLLLGDAGQIVLLQPGLRAILRPVEGTSLADLRPEAYDYLAPERVLGGTPPTPASDMYSAACVWWHFLAGRTPRTGGSSLAKLQAAASGRLPDLGRLVQGVPTALADAIAACTAPDPSARPPSLARLATLLGPPDRAGRACLRRCLRGTDWVTSGFEPFPAARRSRRPRGVAPAVAAGLLVVVTAIVALVWQGGSVLTKKPEPPAIASASARPIAASPEIAPAPTETVVRASHTAPNPVTPTGPTRAESVPLATGARIGSAGGRLAIIVPPTGWLVRVEDVCFENIDFQWSAPTQAARPGDMAIVRLHAGHAEFRGCTFCPAGAAAPAIRWVHPADGADSPLVLPSGRLRLTDCVFQRVDAAVQCAARGAVAIEFSNTLQVEGGPLVRLGHWPSAEESLRITLVRTTLRETGGVLHCPYEATLAAPGPIVIQAVQSGLFPSTGKSLLTLAGSEPPGRVVEAVEWTGEGSLIGLQAAVAMWQSPDAATHPVDDSRLAISGVARSAVQFAGAVGDGPEACRITQWQGPLRSPDPPGVDTSRLPALSRVPEGS